MSGAGSLGDVKRPSPPENCSTCGAFLESVAGCAECKKRMEQPSDRERIPEKRPFKPYTNPGAPQENALYNLLSRTFSRLEPCKRPWCGLGLEADLLAVSPTNLTVADLREVPGVRQGIVHVPQHWRQPWFVEAADGTRHQISENPCDQAERSISRLRRKVESLTSVEGEPASRLMKYLMIFPDGYKFEGPKEYFIVERREVLTLQVRNFCDLAAAILETTSKQRLESRKCRSWVEGKILSNTDDSILGTWLDPAFDQVEPEPPKTERWRFQLSYKRIRSEKQEGVSPEGVRLTPTRKILDNRRAKLFGVLIVGMVLGTVGWRVSDANKSLTVSQSNPPESSSPNNNVSASEALQAAAPAIAKHGVATDGESSERRHSDLKRHPEQASDRADPSKAATDSDLKQRRLELEIDKAIRRRAIAGVTVQFKNGRAYLKGRVASERQKAAAEKAARNVPGVVDVRSSIETGL